jgi:hypothetical protein
VVVGNWSDSPFGAFADVMVEQPDGHRLLLAPTEEVARFVGGVYTFDEVRVTAVVVRREPGSLRVDAAPLEAEVGIGARTPLGRLLRVVPDRVATSTAWATAVDPIARRLRSGVRTRGETPGGTEHYGATDEWSVLAVEASWDGHDLGGLADVVPPVRFGFSSSPARPSLVAVVTTVRPR